jgi:magnesium chelatase subunit I
VAIQEQDIDAVAEFALRHRRRDTPPPQQPPAPPQTPSQPPATSEAEQGQGNWGELPAQSMPVGARREVPSWPKKP